MGLMLMCRGSKVTLRAEYGVEGQYLDKQKLQEGVGCM